MVLILLIIIAALITINVSLWRTGGIGQAENPKTVLDRPVMEAKERKAVMKRLKRWKEEGKLTPFEFEHFYQLCASEWDDNHSQTLS